MPLPARQTLADEAALAAAAARLAELLRPGDALLLAGPLGAGKTRFVQALAAAMGCDDIVASPTYTLMHIHETGRGRLLHLDAYRLSGGDEYRDLGVEELAADAVVAVEWGERVAALHPDHLLLTLAFVAGNDAARELHLRPSGRRWASLVAAQPAAAP